jgi:hypothetical protein
VNARYKIDEADQHGDARDPTCSLDRLATRAAQIDVDRLLLHDDHLEHRSAQRGHGTARGFVGTLRHNTCIWFPIVTDLAIAMSFQMSPAWRGAARTSALASQPRCSYGT